MAKPTVKTNVEMFENLYKDHAYRFESLPGTSLTWTPAKLVKLYELVNKEPKLTQDEIADVLKVDRSTIGRKSSSMDWDIFESDLFSLCTMTDKQFIAKSATEYRLESLAKSSVDINKSLIKREALEQHLHEKIVNSTIPLEYKLPPFNIIKKNVHGDEQPEAAVLLLSDLHVGQEFSNSETGGLNEYNPKVFLKRANNLRQSLVDLVTFHEAAHKIPELYILSLGDCVHGTNLGGEWGPDRKSVV